jgi:hypothetical protein
MNIDQHIFSFFKRPFQKLVKIVKSEVDKWMIFIDDVT